MYKRGLEIGDASYICEISYNRRGFFIALFSVQEPARCLSLHLRNCEKTDQILRWYNSDFDKMAKHIKIRDGKIRLSKLLQEPRPERHATSVLELAPSNLP